MACNTSDWVQLSLLVAILTLCVIIAYKVFTDVGTGEKKEENHNSLEGEVSRVYEKLYRFWAPDRVLGGWVDKRLAEGGVITGRADVAGIDGERMVNDTYGNADGATRKSGDSKETGELKFNEKIALDNGVVKHAGIVPAEGKRKKRQTKTRRG